MDLRRWLPRRRDPNNFNRQWRQIRAKLGAPGVSTHSFRKTVATLIDEQGLSPRASAPITSGTLKCR